MQEIIKEAVEAAGGPVKIAAALDMATDQTVRHWIKKGRIPPQHVVKVCQMGGGRFTPAQVCPEIFEGVGAGA